MVLTRRRFVFSALAAGTAAGGLGALIANGDTQPAFVWRGSALGGEARISLYGGDPDQARMALEASEHEIERLEQIFSLHRDSSQLSRLNAAKVLSSPARDLADQISLALDWRVKTHGAFDPAIQKMWLAAANGREAGSVLRDRPGRDVVVEAGKIILGANTELSLNGIAQGRIADRVTEVLASFGFDDVVVNAGELRLPGSERRAIGIPAAKAAVSVARVAVATSEPRSLVFDQATWRHHLIEPGTGLSPRHWESISVFAPTAETADALSTAFAVLPHDAVADLAASFRDVAVIGLDGRGRVRRFGDLSVFGGRSSS